MYILCIFKFDAQLESMCHAWGWVGGMEFMEHGVQIHRSHKFSTNKFFIFTYTNETNF